ncbi:hypothetical protein DYB37_002683 [Aphanomyces astaci]|uniref:CWH43-like N-terminal domain-containing protein n=1 Tax=Aphanomyces astaci TaxID=112090 RepID=A0A3R7A5I7_APHAT|nr:hypothetical protein DYB35_005137 [Aphanomyces astaci]RHZ30465.1 hypothetical protein DYB37_002683 [Aphanomyces astaci]
MDTVDLPNHIQIRVVASDSSSSDDSEDDDSSSDEGDDSHPTPSDSLGFVPIVLGVVASLTCVGTVSWGCVHPRIDCRVSWPTLSDAARFRPQQTLFAVGVLLTSLLWVTTVLLLHWHSRLQPDTSRHRVLSSAILLCGLASSMCLLALGFTDTRAHYADHRSATVGFFLTIWATAGCICALRRRRLTPPPRSDLANGLTSY